MSASAGAVLLRRTGRSCNLRRLVRVGAAALFTSALLMLFLSSSASRRVSWASPLSARQTVAPGTIQPPGWLPPDAGLDDGGNSTESAAAAASAGNSEAPQVAERRRDLMRAYWAKVARHFPNGGPDSPQYRLLQGRCRRENYTAAAAAADSSPPVGFVNLPYLLNFGPCTGRVGLVLAVHSAVTHAPRRRVIRETWGSARYVRGRRVLLVFFLGRSTEHRLQAAVAAEAARHGDIVQRDFVDTYRNLTLKHLGLYDWLAEFCPTADWLVKVDDDVFVDVFHLESFLTAYKPAGICCKLQDGRPERVLSDKWFVTREEFPGDKYPKYCEGYAYIMQPTVAQLLYWCSVFPPSLWIDDVYVLGILVEKLGLKPQLSVGGHLWADLLPSHTGRAIMNNIFLVDRHNGLQAGTWRRLHRAAMLYSY